MGDIKTHREIYETFIRGHLPAGVDPLFVELGNFFTDVSQFHDPWAHVGGKAEVWRKTKPKLPWFARIPLVADLAGVDDYLDFLLGRPDPGDPQGRRRVPHGKLAEWFREVIYAYALEKSFRRKEDPKDYLIDPDEFRRLYDLHYTQYFPHEHLDFQPGPTGRLDNFEASRILSNDGANTRRIVSYLDADIEYVGDLLTAVERDWARATAVDAKKEHDLLVRFGHACHAVEDFFFHSNFTELAEAHARPGQDVVRFAPDETKDEHDLEGDRVPPPESVRWDRIFFRRLRQPVYGADGETQFSDTQSLPAQIVFTAAIPMPDIFHTFFDAIGFLTEQPTAPIKPVIAAVNDACRSNQDTAAVLLRIVTALPADHMGDLPWAFMAEMVSENEAERDEAYAAYRCLMRHRMFERIYQILVASGRVHHSVADAITKACTIERELWTYRHFLTEEKVGAMKFMMDLLAEGRDVFQEARKKNEELDTTSAAEKTNGVAPEQRTGWLPSFNGSTGERIGTHSLMSKDSVRKQPLRRQTMNAAGFTVSYITKTLVAQRTGGQPVDSGVDWHELLRYFLTHPEQAGPASGTEWWRKALEWKRTEADRPPEGHQLRPVPGAGADDRATTIANRAAEAKRAKLELLYNDLAEVGEQRYRDAVNHDWIMGSLIWGSVIGGVSGGITAGVVGDSVGEVLLGTLAGGVVGALASGVLTGVGTAIDDGTGASIGLLLGLTAAGVGGYFVGREVGAGVNATVDGVLTPLRNLCFVVQRVPGASVIIRPMIGEVEVPSIERIASVEGRHVAVLPVPGLLGDLSQDLGAQSLAVEIEGSLHGDADRDDFLGKLRPPFLAGDPVPFVADILTATKVDQVLIESLDVEERNDTAGGFRYRVVVRQYVEPPEPPPSIGDFGLDIDDALGDVASLGLDGLALPDLLGGIPDIANPVPPLLGALDGVKQATSGLGTLLEPLKSALGV